jgi:hypothetical protein
MRRARHFAAGYVRYTTRHGRSPIKPTRSRVTRQLVAALCPPQRPASQRHRQSMDRFVG